MRFIKVHWGVSTYSAEKLISCALTILHRAIESGDRRKQLVLRLVQINRIDRKLPADPLGLQVVRCGREMEP